MRTRSFRRSGRRRSSQTPVRNREWIGFTTSPSGNLGEPGRIIIVPGNGFSDWCVVPDDLEDFFDEPTLVRTLISDMCHPVAPNTAASISCSLYVGLMAVKGDEATPPWQEPLDAAHEWIYWSQWMMFNGGTSDGFVNAGPTRNGGDTIDIKSKRKLPVGYGLALYAACPSNNSHNVVWAFNGRCLLLNN